MQNKHLGLGLIGAAMVRALTPEEINNNRGAGPLHRTATVRNIDEDARTVEVAFSSETPVARWFGDEILDHSAGAMQTERLDDGAAVLWNHNPDVQIGVVESARVDRDRVGRAVLRFGTSARAAEIWADIVAGVIRHVSVGYSVRDIKIEQREGEPDEITVTRWEPYEISLVSIPADASVGVGRALGNPPEAGAGAGANTAGIGERDDASLASETSPQDGAESMKTKIVRNAAGALVRAKVDENGAILEEIEVLMTAEEVRAMGSNGDADAAQERATRILELGEQYNALGRAAEAVRAGTSVEDFTRSLVDVVAARAASPDTSQSSTRALDDRGAPIGMTSAEADRFSFIRALRALANPTDRAAQEAAAFEFEASTAAARQLGRDAQGIMVPPDVLTRALNTGTDGAAAGDTGGLAIGTTLLSSSFIEMLRNRSVFTTLATPLGGLMGNFSLLGQASGATGYWVGDDEDVGEGTQDLRDIDLSPKTVGAYSEITRQTLRQTSIDVEGMVRRDLALALALTIDSAGFYGDGVKKPLGIKNLDGLNAVDFAAVQPTFAEIVQMESEISADNADAESMAYVGNSKFRGHAKTTEKFAGANGATIWESGGQVNGYRAEITNQIADGDLFHGNFADAIVGAWGGLDLTVDPFTHSTKGRLRIVAFQDVDVAFRHVESFCYGVKQAA